MDRAPGRRAQLIRITAPHYCAGLEVENGWITNAAPILFWSIGRRWDRVRPYFERKRFKIEEL